MTRTYTKKERNMYLIGLSGQNMIYQVVGIGLLFYLQSVIFLPAIAISVIMSVARVWDGINDPMMGTIVDKTRTKWGKCRPYLLFAPAVICVITILCFCNGIYSDSAATSAKALIIGWAAVAYLLWGMAYTVGDIPIWGIISLMTEDEGDRSRLISLARIVAGIGAGIVTVAITPVSQALGVKLEGAVGVYRSQQMGFILVAVVLSVIGSGMFQLAGIFTREHVEQPSRKQNFKENVKMMWNNRPFRAILISGVLRSPSMLLQNIAMTLLAYYYGDYYGNYIVYMIILGGGLFLGMFGTTAITPKLIEKFEKKKIYNLSNLICAIPFAFIFVAYKIAPTGLDEPLWVAVCFVLFALGGCSMGALNVLQSVMIADAVDYEEYRNGIRPDGVFFSGQSFITKLSSGLCSILSGVAYTVVGFSGSNVEACNLALKAGASFKTDFPEYASAMFFLCSIPPAIGMILSVLPMRGYDLTDKKHAEILEVLVKKRAELGAGEEV